MKLHIRRFVPALTVGTLLTLVLSASATADTIVLKSGQKIEGQVLKVQEDVIFVDIGIDVIKVPVDSIDKRMEDDAKEEATQAVTQTSAGLLKMAKLPVKTVKDLVKRYAEGVVLIQNPGGLGSGLYAAPMNGIRG